MNAVQRNQAVRRVLLGILALNAIVTAAKAAAAVLSGSLAVRADAFHSLLDAAANVVGLAAIAAAAKAPDAEHPYGHRKFEVLGAMGIGVLLAIAAYNIVREAWARAHGAAVPVAGDLAAFAVMGGTLLANLAISAYERRRGRELGSELLLADSAHTRSDILATVSVIAALACARAGIAWADLVVALALALFIAWTAVRISMATVRVLADRAVLDPAEVARVASAVLGVRACHEIRSRGPSDSVFADLRIHVAPETSLAQAHEIAHTVEERLRASFPGLRDVVVHVEPDDAAHP